MQVQYSDAAVNRLWSKVDKSGACWLRRSALTDGYSIVSMDGVRIGAHVAAFRLVASLPKGFIVCHTCDVRNCVRNDDAGVYVINGVARLRFGHLWAGTPEENRLDMIAKGRIAHGDRHMSRVKPEALHRGDQHWTRRHPEWLKWGDDNPVRQRPAIVQGTMNGNAKLTDNDVREIRRLRADGVMSNAAIGRQFGVSAVLIGLIVRGKAWKHVL